MAKETVVFLPTPEVKALAQKALDIQSACNGLAVTHFLTEVQRFFRNDRTTNKQNYCGGDLGNQNPVTVAILNKLNDLALLEQSRTECFTYLYDLVDGKEVSWEINFL